MKQAGVAEARVKREGRPHSMEHLSPSLADLEDKDTAVSVFCPVISKRPVLARVNRTIQVQEVCVISLMGSCGLFGRSRDDSPQHVFLRKKGKN